MTKYCLDFLSRNNDFYSLIATLRKIISPSILFLLIAVQPLLFTQANAADAKTVGEQKAADIRVLIDVSGSMKQNDPRNLRRPAMDLLVQLFPNETRAGVWTFGKYVNMLVPHKDVADKWRDQAASKSRLVNSVALHTNIGMALEKANYDSDIKNYPATANFKKSVILLTDGVVDISKDPDANDKERERILNKILPAYKKAGIKIHAIALSTNADVELLERLSIETDGVFAVAEDAEDLNRIFLRAFDQSSPGDRTPLEDNRFLIDSSVEEFTALVFRKQGSDATQIQSPAGQIYNAQTDGASVRWFASEAYDLITINQPEEGEWKINAEMDPENRVTVVSDLSLAIDTIDNNLYHGQVAQLNASLLESGAPVSRDEFLNLLTVEAQMSRDYTKFWQQTIPRDFDAPGIYSRKLDMLRNSGDYALTVVVDGKTFKREKTVKFTVREPFRVELAANEELGEYTLTVMADDKRLRTDAIAVTANIQLPDGSVVDEVLEYNSTGAWVYQATGQSSGKYIISVNAQGENNVGDTIDRSAGEHSLYMSVPGAPEPERIVEPVPEPVLEEVVEPEPVIEEPIVEAPVEEVVFEEIIEEPVEEKAKTNWLLYGGLVVGYLLLIGVLFIVYKKLLGGKSTEDDAEEGEQGAAEEAAEEEAPAEDDVAEELDDSLEDIDDMEMDVEDAIEDIADDAIEDTVEEVVENSAKDSAKDSTDSNDKSGDDFLDDDLSDDVMESLGDDLSTDDLATDDLSDSDSLVDDLMAEADDDLADLGLDDIAAEEVKDEALDQDALDEIDLDAMLDVDEDTPATAAAEEAKAAVEDDEDDVEINLDFDEPAGDDDIDDDIEAILAAADDKPAADESADDDDITLDLDGEFDLSSDISEEAGDDGDSKSKK